MTSWTTPADVTGAWIGPDEPTDMTKVQVWIDKAEREIRRRVPDIQTRITAELAHTPPSTALEETTKDVVVAMVTRRFQNPRGLRQVSTVTGPFTESETVGGANPGQLHITDDEMAKLIGVPEGRAFSIDLIPSTSPFFRSAS